MPATVRALYPEVLAGGFSHVDGTVDFYLRIHALLADLGPGATVLDFGAGRGAAADDPVPFRRQLRDLRSKAGKVVGMDIDAAVLTNPLLDQADVVVPGEPLPLADASVDLVVADHTFEHVTDPAWVSRELDRVLRPGGWLCARTPNRWGYIGAGARAVPNRHHVRALRRLQPTKPGEDTFPTAYRLNTRHDLARWFPGARYELALYAADSEPAYVGRSVMAARLNRVLFALTPPRWRSVLYAFLHKRPDANGGTAGQEALPGADR